ncbi:MAG TPA: MOSC domain-containing protein, partial [Acidimicrobiales bacterium]|nr:MOSC domain-containing protein [Acidimicrobiales bacterium]
MPEYLGHFRGQPITSGIAKRPVTAEYLWLDRLNLEGDAQADLEVHGGPDKAVYAYPSEHLPAWSAELEQELGPAPFGENLSTAGATEDDVCIGDRWYWGDAVLEVCQPRYPCFKLSMHRGRGDIGRLLRQTGQEQLPLHGQRLDGEQGLDDLDRRLTWLGRLVHHRHGGAHGMRLDPNRPGHRHPPGLEDPQVPAAPARLAQQAADVAPAPVHAELEAR